MIAGVLEVQMLAGLARLSKDMQDAKSMVGNAVGTIEKTLGALGVGFSAHLLIAKFESVVEAMDKVQTASEKTGASVENLSKLQFFAGVSGSSLEGVTGALSKLSKGMAVGAEDAGKVTQALKFLGLTAKDASGNLKDPAALFEEISKKLFAYQDGAGKAAIAQALFGKSGVEILPTLKKMAELGAVEATMTGEQARAAEDYQVKIARLAREKETLYNLIVSSLLPTMGTWVEMLTRAAKETDSLQSKAAGLARDGTIERWADGASMGIARMIDVLKTFLGMLDEILAPMELFFVKAQAGWAAIAIVANTNSWAVKDAALQALREQTAAQEVEIRKRFNTEGFWAAKTNTQYSENLAKQIKLRKAAAEDAARDMEGSSRSGEGKALNFALSDGKAAAKLEAAALLQYVREVNKLENALGKLNHQTEVQKLTFELYGQELKTADGTVVHLTGSLEKMMKSVNGPEWAKNLLLMAALADARKRLLEIMEATKKAMEAENAANEKRNETIAAQHIAYAQAASDETFELGLIGKSVREIELLNAARKVELDLRQRIAQLPKLDEGATQAQIDENKRAERMLRENAKQRTKDAQEGAMARVAAERDWVTGAKGAFNQYVDDATNAALQTKNAFAAGFKALEDTMFEFFRHGKLGITNFVGMIKDALARLAAQQFTLSIVTSIGGALGIPGAANAAGGGIGGIGNLLSGASSVSNMFSGQGMMGNIGRVLGISSTTAMGASTTALASLGTEGMATYAAMESLAAGATAATGAMATLGAAIPYVGIALAAAYALGLFDEGGGPKPSEAFFSKSNGYYQFGLDNITDKNDGPNAALADSYIKALNDPTKYDQAKLAQFAEQRVGAANAQGGIDALLKLIESARIDPEIAKAADVLTESFKTMREAIYAAEDPMGFWTVKMNEMQKELGTNANTVEGWRAEFLTAMDGTLTPEQFAKWQQFGGVIQNITSLTAKSLEEAEEQKNASELEAETSRRAIEDSFKSVLNLRRSVMQSLLQFETRLSTSEFLSPLDRLSGARAGFQDIATRARLGDMDAAQRLGDSANQYLAAGRSVFASGSGFQDIFSEVNSAVRDAATVNQRNLSVLLTETPAAITAGFADQIREMQEGFQSVVDAVERLSSGVRQAVT